MRHGRQGATAARHLLSLSLLVVHLLVFVLGGALLGATPARAAGGHTLASAAVAAGVAGEGPAVASSSAPRVELATRARTRTDRGSGAPPLEAVVAYTTPAIAPASRVASSDARSTTHERRPPPSVVDGPRGPPQAR